jgi:excisionase family DNA binding protein
VSPSPPDHNPRASATPPSASDTLLTPSDVARRCQISTKTVLRAIRSGRLPASRLGARAAYRIRPADVEAWLTDSQVEAVVVPLRSRDAAPAPGPPVGGRLSVPRTASSR